MNYAFPQINHLQEALDAIEGCPDFIVVDRGDHTIVNYVVTSGETFPPVTDSKSAIRRECRGLIFCNKTGKVLSRRFQKFFNYGERDEVMPDKIDFSKPHVVLQKLDGSMITPFFTGGVLRWGTKLGLTDVAAQVDEWIKYHQNYVVFSGQILKSGKTPIYEWTSRKQRIVLDYPVDNLVLIAIRDNISGEYMPFKTMAKMAFYGEIPVVEVAWQGDDSTSVMLSALRNTLDMEGVVVRFDDGHMIKVKTDWYVRLHKTKEMLHSERDVVDLVLRNQLDDLLPILMEEDKKRVENFRDRVLTRMHLMGRHLRRDVNTHKKKSRKDFALEDAPKIDPMWRSLIFSHWETTNTLVTCRDYVYNAVLEHVGSNKSFEKVKAYILKDVDYLEKEISNAS